MAFHLPVNPDGASRDCAFAKGHLELDQKTRGGGSATYLKVKRIYIAGNVKNWQVGTVRKRTGREVQDGLGRPDFASRPSNASGVA